jgi:peptidoglycan hydrolase-like protein with peptidoglycan-binding domain/predicted  nucleic acid-binding Zn-ribbon protein
VSDKHFLAEDPDTHDQVIVLGQTGTHKIEELARDLLAVRHDYHELGQRASALASERDAVAARLAAARADAESARRQLEELQEQRDTGGAALQTRLQAQQAELAEQRHRVEQLEARLAQSERRSEVLRDQYEQEQRALDSERVAQLDALGARLAVAGDQQARLEAERKALAAQLEQAQQAADAERDAARKQIDALEQRLADSESRHSTAVHTARELEASLSTATDEQQRTAAQLATLEQQRDALAAELEQAQVRYRAEQDAAREQISTLEQRLADSESRHSTAVHTARELEASLSTATDEQQRTAAQLATLEQQRDALAAELEQARVRYRAERDAAGKQIDALEQRLAALEAEHATSLQRADELETSLTAAAEHRQSTAHRITELEQTLSDERGALQAELDSTREALARARAEQQQACDEQARLTDALGRVEQQLAEAERLNQTAREAADARIAAAETAQRTLGEKVRELAEQLHAQHQQQDRLEQQARDQSAVDRQVRTELERESGALQAELVRLQQELERHRSAASAPPGDSPAGPNSWKMVAGASLLLGSMASATAYWNAARDGQNRVAADTAVRSPARHAIARSPTDPRQSSPLAASPALVLSAAGAARLPAPAAETQSTAGMAAADRLRHHDAPDTGTAMPDGATPTGTTDGAATSAMLQSTARASLRALDDALTIDGLELQSDASIRQQQDDLIALGFDLGEARADGVKGKYTRQALAEFQQYYLPADGPQEGVDAQQLASLVSVFAAIARSDQQAFSIDGEVLAAIRLSSLRTGLDFPYLMELAYTESSFDPAKKARRSSAAGLYQFTEATWLGSVKAYGAKYGLGLYASEIEYATDSNGRPRPRVANPVVYRHILALRHNPRIAALLAAEFALSNKQQLTRRIGPGFGRTELYLAHFFGIENALEFLRLLEQHPDRVAAELFPNAAQSNPGVFEPTEGSRITLREVYDFFAAKFDTGRYETLNPALALVQES